MLLCLDIRPSWSTKFKQYDPIRFVSLEEGHFCWCAGWWEKLGYRRWETQAKVRHRIPAQFRTGAEWLALHWIMSITQSRGEWFLDLWVPLTTHYVMRLSLFTMGSPCALRIRGGNRHLNSRESILARGWLSGLLFSDFLNCEEI